MRADPFVTATLPSEITRAIRAVLGLPDLDLDAGTLLEELPGWDSMLHIAIMVELECRFGIEVAPREVEAVVSVDDLVRMVGAKQVLNAS
ncbi:MAG: hypothetical protein BGO51_10835 [Rhodospirillales bacterium 69-11]|nr:acyl carrier protein [Rhodospirillales bacterium]OJW29536.1 MAG: hypothetical protein BGO51_10835 [Rhodospirillales bacterium 69-11]